MTSRSRRTTHKGHPASAATRAKISRSLTGKHHPHKGVHPSATARAHQSAAHKGKPHPHKGVHPSAATRARISHALAGKHHAAAHAVVRKRTAVSHRTAAHTTTRRTAVHATKRTVTAKRSVATHRTRASTRTVKATAVKVTKPRVVKARVMHHYRIRRRIAANPIGRRAVRHIGGIRYVKAVRAKGVPKAKPMVYGLKTPGRQRVKAGIRLRSGIKAQIAKPVKGTRATKATPRARKRH